MNQSEDTAKVIYSFARGENEKIQLELRPYKGRYYIDLRLWFQDTPESPYTPTKKGVSFSSDSIGELKKGVLQLEQACEGLKPKPTADSAPKPGIRPQGRAAGYSRPPASSWPQQNRS